jgi:hypothetical protein
MALLRLVKGTAVIQMRSMQRSEKWERRTVEAIKIYMDDNTH